jgi:acetolactate synthase-1/2/3 large subunit
MNGAEGLVHTLVGAGVDVCFTNPGTSEMHFVVALDKVPGMRCILGLFEGVVTGAADGFARMADKPAATLLHLGPGLGNGLANLHNARKANSPMVNIVGEHATYHIEHDAPLIARPVSHWVRTARSAETVASDAALAIQAAQEPPGHIATLILPADTAWQKSPGAAQVAAPAPRPHTTQQKIDNAAQVLRSGEPSVILLAGLALRESALRMAGRIAAATGAALMAPLGNARLQRGAGRVAVQRIPYPVDQALALLAGYRHFILVGADAPVAFFAYPDKPSLLAPPGCSMHRLTDRVEDPAQALEWLADELGAKAEAAVVQELARPAQPRGGLTKDSLAAALGALIPENAIVVDESVSTGRGFFPSTAGAPPTLQSLWTQAREGLDVTTVVFANRDYAILKGELINVGAANPGRKALDMLEIGRPDLDWVDLARGMGVDGVRVQTAEEFCRALQQGIAAEGPYLIEVVL